MRMFRFFARHATLRRALGRAIAGDGLLDRPVAFWRAVAPFLDFASRAAVELHKLRKIDFIERAETASK